MKQNKSNTKTESGGQVLSQLLMQREQLTKIKVCGNGSNVCFPQY